MRRALVTGSATGREEKVVAIIKLSNEGAIISM